MTTMSAADALGIDFAALGNARLIDLAQPMKNGMPQSPNHPPFRMILERRHGDMVRSDGGSASNEVIITVSFTCCSLCCKLRSASLG